VGRDSIKKNFMIDRVKSGGQIKKENDTAMSPTRLLEPNSKKFIDYYDTLLRYDT
jgi:hypothetical protein